MLHRRLIEPFSYDFMLRGLLSALLLSISGGLLGSVLVLRRLALMGDALTHSLLPGLALAHQLYISLQAQGGGRQGTHALELALARLSGIDWEART